MMPFKVPLLQYKTYLKNSCLYLSSSLLTAVIGILINPLMAKNLSPGDYAILGYFSSFNLILLPILNFSLISYYLRNYYRLPEERKQVVSDTILIALLVYGLVALTAACTLFYLYARWSGVSFAFYPYGLLAFLPIYLENVTTLYLVNCRLKSEAAKYNKLSTCTGLISTALAVHLVVFCQYGATGRLLATLFTSLAAAIYCFRSMFGTLQFDFSVIRDAVRFGWPLSLSAMLWYFLSGVDRAMLERLHDGYTFGFYNVGLQLAGYFGVFYTAISQTFEPDIYRAIAEDNRRRVARILVGVVSLNAIPNIVFIIFAPFIIGILTYNRYTDASGYARILALKNITVSMYYATITVIVGYGFTKADLAIRLVGAALSILMFKVLIERFGFYGAAWGQVASFVVLALISMGYLLFLYWQEKAQTKRVMEPCQK